MSTTWGSKVGRKRGSQDLMREGAGLGVCSPFLTTNQEPCAAPAVECCGDHVGHRKSLSRQGFLGPKLQPAPGIPDAEVRGGTMSYGGQSKGWRGPLSRHRAESASASLRPPSGQSERRADPAVRDFYHFVQHRRGSPLANAVFCSSEQRCLAPSRG